MRRFARFDRREIADRVHCRNGRIKFWFCTKERQIIGDEQSAAVPVADGRSVVPVGGFRKDQRQAFGHTDKNQPLPLLGDAEMRRVQYSPVTLVPNTGEARQYFFNRFATLMSSKANDILHYKNRWLEVVDKICKLLEQAVSWVIP